MSKLKKRFIFTLAIYAIVIVLSIVEFFINLYRGDIFYICLSIVKIVAWNALFFWVKNKLNPFVQIIDEYEKLKEKSWNMSIEELMSLNDEDLSSALEARIDKEIEKDYEEPKKCLEILNEEKQVIYILKYFDEEVQNGGLCQFFVNSSRVLAPYISETLGSVGADKYRKLYNDFVDENNIDLTDLSSFIIEDTKEYEKQYERYDFDKFDDAFYELCEEEPLDNFIAKYARLNIEKIAEKPGK